MWTRRELKEQAKDALKRNYWKAVLVTVLFGALLGGTGGAAAAGVAVSSGSGSSEDPRGRLSGDSCMSTSPDC